MKVDLSFFTQREFTKGENELPTVDEDTMVKAFARMLKEVRKASGYTLKQVAAETGVAFQSIARYEIGENIPNLIQAYKLAYFYEMSLHDMFFWGFLLLTNVIPEFDKGAWELYKQQAKEKKNQG